MSMRIRGSFKITGDECNPLFLNTVTIFITYVLIIIVFIHQASGIIADTSTATPDWNSILNKFVDSIAVSTVTYVLTTAMQNWTTAKTRRVPFPLSIWAIALCFIYAMTYALFIPGSTPVCIFLSCFTVFLIILTAKSIREVWESGQAIQSNINQGESDGCIT